MGYNIRMIISKEYADKTYSNIASIDIGKMIYEGAISKLLEKYRNKKIHVYTDVTYEMIHKDMYGEELVKVPADEFLRALNIDNQDNIYRIPIILLENMIHDYEENELYVIIFAH